MLAGAVCDFCDGAAARALGAYSDIGKELDSLSDLVTFGLAPALMFFTWYYKVNTDYPSWVAFIPLLIVPMSAVRLARFNIDDRQKTNFIGLPTPALAMTVGSATAYSHVCLQHDVDAFIPGLLCSSWFIPVFSVVLALLLVSDIPMFSLKGDPDSKKASGNKKVMVLAAVLIIVLCIVTRRAGVPFFAIAFLALFFIFVWYIFAQIVGLVMSK